MSKNNRVPTSPSVSLAAGIRSPSFSPSSPLFSNELSNPNRLVGNSRAESTPGFFQRSASSVSLEAYANDFKVDLEDFYTYLRGIHRDRTAQLLANAFSALSLSNISRTLAPPLTPILKGPSLTSILTQVRTIQSLPESAELSSNEVKHGVCRIVMLCAVHAHRLFLHALLQQLNALQPHISYWRHRPRPTIFAAMSNLLGLTEPTSNLTKLRAMLQFHKRWTTRAGLLSYHLTTLQLLASHPLSFRDEPLDHVLVLCSHYLGHLFVCTTGDSAPKYSTNPSPFQLLDLIEKIFLSLEEFNEWWHDQMSPYKKPSHLERKWLHYTVGISAIAYSAYLIHSQRTEITQYLQTTAISFKAFAKEHVVEPLQNIYISTFHRNGEQSLVSAEESYLASQKNLSDMLENYGKQHLHLNATAEGIAVDEYIKTLPVRAKACDMSIVMSTYTTEVEQPLKNSVFGTIVEGLLIQIQKVKVDVEESLVTLDQLLRANEINFNMLATLPAVVVFAGLLVATNRVIRRISHHGRDRSQVYAAIKKRLLILERLCIEYTHWAEKRTDVSRLADYNLTWEQWPERHEMGMNEENASDEDEDEENSRNVEDKQADLPPIASEQDMVRQVNPQVMLSVKNTLTMPTWAYGQVLLHCASLASLISALPVAEGDSLLSEVEYLANAHLAPMQKILMVNSIFRAHSSLTSEVQ